VMDANAEALQAIADTLLEEGVTGFLATTMTEALPDIEAALACCYEFRASQRQGATLLGVHLEGPFLSQDYMGAQSGTHLRPPNPDLLQDWLKRFPNLIQLLTLAPELPGALDFITYAHSQNIRVSIGHTKANFEETIAGINAGASYATHLFNAMSGMHHREPGAAAALLVDDRVTAELIADGVHVAPAMLNLALKCKGSERLVLVTDAMRAKCLRAGTYDLGGQNVVVDDEGTARLERNGVLAGSTLKLNQALNNFQRFTKRPLTKLLAMVTSTPARLLAGTGTQALAGNGVHPGGRADLVVVTEQVDIIYTIKEGKIVYRAS